MNRFNTTTEVKAWALTAALSDHMRHIEHGVDLNPYCTPGARSDWLRGFRGEPPRPYDHDFADDWSTHYQRGRAASSLMKGG